MVSSLLPLVSDDELTDLLRIILRIPLHSATCLTSTSASKRTYAFSIYTLTYLRLPNRILKPLAEQIVEACKRATSSTILPSGQNGTASNGRKGAGAGNGGSADGNQKARVEGLGAIYNVLSRNASVFLAHSEELLPILLKGLVDKSPAPRCRSTAGLGAALLQGREWVAELEQDLKEALAVEQESVRSGEGRVARAKKAKERKRCEEELKAARKVVEEDVPAVAIKCLKRRTGSEDRMIVGILGALKAAVERDGGT